MAEITSFDLLLAASAVGVAVWTELISDPEDRVNMFENKFARQAMRWMLLLSATLLLIVFGAFGAGLYTALTNGSLGVGGTALFLVITSISLIGIPVIAKIYIEGIRELDRLETYAEFLAVIAMLAIIGGTVIFLVAQVT